MHTTTGRLFLCAHDFSCSSMMNQASRTSSFPPVYATGARKASRSVIFRTIGARRTRKPSIFRNTFVQGRSGGERGNTKCGMARGDAMDEPGAVSAVPIRVDIFADLSWPACYVAKKQFDIALTEFTQEHPTVELKIFWHAYMADRSVDRKGETKDAYLKKKFRGEIPLPAIERQAAKKLGVTFSQWEFWPNTFQAQRLMLLAGQAGKAHDLAEVLFQMTFERGLNIGYPEVLEQAAVEVSLEHGADFLGTGEGYMEVEAQDQQAKNGGVRLATLPLVLLGDGAFKLMGPQPASSYSSALLRALQDALLTK